jgi:hypothetical protein
MKLRRDFAAFLSFSALKSQLVKKQEKTNYDWVGQSEVHTFGLDGTKKICVKVQTNIAQF